MSVLVLDPAGRPLKPVPPRKAEGKVLRGHARWLHAPRCRPDTRAGTIVLTHGVSPEPETPAGTQVFNADGVRLGWVSREAAEARVRKGILISVGGGLNAAILPRRVPRSAMRLFRKLECGLAWRRLLDRERVVGRIMRRVLEGGDPREALEELVTSELGRRPAEITIGELRAFLRQLSALDLLAAGDLTDLRRALLCEDSGGRPPR